MSKIPDDIREAADEALTAAILELDNGEGDSIAIIAAAIHAERLRCAEIAKAWSDTCRKLGQTFEADAIDDVLSIILNPRRDQFPVFEYVEKFNIAGRGELYSGPSPFEDTSRNFEWIGQKIIVDGKVRVIRGVETFMSHRGPRKGSPIGLLLSPLDSKVV